MRLSFLKRAESWSSLRSRVRVSKRVLAVLVGFFFHRNWVEELNGPNEIAQGGLILCFVNVCKTLVIFTSC